MKTLCKIVFWTLISWVFSSFICGSPVPLTPSVPSIYYRNNQGFDLLDPSTKGNFNHNDIAIKWVNPDGSIGTVAPFIFLQSSISPYLPYFPNGYRFSINPFGLIDNNGNSGIVQGNTVVVFIQLNKLDTDTVTFVHSGSTLRKFLYNKTLISPPTHMASYPAVFPVIITK